MDLRLRAGPACEFAIRRETGQKGYVAHAALETHAALAEFKNSRMTVWRSTQTPFPERDKIAKVPGLRVRTSR